MKRILALVVVSIIGYFAAVFIVYAQNDAVTQRLQDSDRTMEHQITINTERLTDVERRLTALDSMQLERRMTTLENNYETLLKMGWGMVASLITLLVNALWGWFRKPTFGCNVATCPHFPRGDDKAEA